ncbi:MAG TPA: MgtC/SapB family protein [Nitrobacter sp.]|jgi:putative Mg2+ transporter-C (MgtC) family protein|nr:MgtC/SapB family protein [Nitrobacter sp.]
MDMPLQPTWADIAIRIALTMIAGGIVGFDRGVRGHAAGFRTTILVGLAASVAMIQANILLPLGGKTPQSFAVMDLMRLPLGILTGVGFIGGGAILKKGDLVTGVTTAATLWLMTVIGLCFGGGQLILGTVATALAFVTLWGLKWVDRAMPRDHRARLTIAGDAEMRAIVELPRLLDGTRYRAQFAEMARHCGDETDCSFQISWRRAEQSTPPDDLLAVVRQHYAVKAFALTTESDP